MQSRSRLTMIPTMILAILAVLSALMLTLWGSVMPVAAEGAADGLAQSTGCITGLTATQCDLFKAASAATPPKTFELGYSLNIGIKGLGASNIEVLLKGSGPFDASKIKGNTLPAIVKALTLSNEGTLSYKAGSRSASQPLDMRFVDGTIYFNTPLTLGGEGMWYKLPLEQFMKDDSPTFDINSMEQFVKPDSLMFGLGSVVLPAGKAVVKAGPTLDGRATTQASIRIEFGKMYDQMLEFQRDAMLQAFFSSMLRSSGAGTQSFDFEKDPQLKAAAERLIKSLLIDVSWLAEPKGKTLRGFGLALSLTIEPKIGKMISPVFANGKTDIKVDMQFTYSKFGQSVSVEAPEGAIDLSPYFQNKTSA